MFDKPLAIVDVETTGMSGIYDRVIEIGIIRVENNEVTEELNTLVNPQTYVSPFIESFTGIKKEELEEAPTFSDLSEQVYSLLNEAILVAHNARFDYSFIRREFKRLGITFSSKTLCTAQLSRRLFPEHRSHGLSALIERFNLACDNRHRAYSDALVLWQFIQKLKESVSKNRLAKIIKILLRSSYSGNEYIKQQIEELPENTGVYAFYDKDSVPLYVGKSKDIKERVISHFTIDYQSSRGLSMIKKIERIDHFKTAGELGALLLESRLIKELMPIFNRQLRRKKEFIAVKKYINNEGYFSLKSEILDTIDLTNLEDILGVFKSKKSAKEAILHLAKEYKLCSKILGVESTNSSCFAYKLRRCKGACIGEELPKKYNARFIIAHYENKQFRPWPFSGAIEIFEKNEEEELYETFMIDKWCLIDSGNELDFDLDTHKIISSFIKHRSPNYRVLG
ncbi:DNA polymerase III subunit epsilon, partial [Candidatus Roizmanbacteria bacterium]|nr:DNA polymerase III subunit epsilon [Candidatus Roizmanbacteria bacterium]